MYFEIFPKFVKNRSSFHLVNRGEVIIFLSNYQKKAPKSTILDLLIFTLSNLMISVIVNLKGKLVPHETTINRARSSAKQLFSIGIRYVICKQIFDEFRYSSLEKPASIAFIVKWSEKKACNLYENKRSSFRFGSRHRAICRDKLQTTKLMQNTPR